MIAPLAKFIDWLAIQTMSLALPRGYGQNTRLEEALQFVNGPEFNARESQPAKIEFARDESRVHFQFPTPQPSPLAENNIVYGRLYRSAGQWRERPVIILLHGAGGFPDYHFRFPLMARNLNQQGWNAATLVAPYHFQRRPRRPEATSSPDCLQIVMAAAQAVAEIRALLGWLVKEGCPAVSLCGWSMGGWYAGLTACRDARVTAAVLAAPAVRMNPWMAKRAIRHRVREQLQNIQELCDQMNPTAVNLILLRPAIPKDNILLIEGMNDLFVPKEDVEDLWRAWQQPEMWRLPHGHAGVCCGGVPALTRRVLRWLSPRMNK